MRVFCVAACVALARAKGEVPADLEDQYASWKAASAAREAASAEGPFVVPPGDEWYTVTIQEVNVGYMNTVTQLGDAVLSSKEVMDVQVSRGTDTSRMAFETVFSEEPSNAKFAAGDGLDGGVQMMAYDQMFADNTVKMRAVFAETGITLTSNNGEKDHVTDLPLPEVPWLGRTRARLEFMKQCREGKRVITVPTMRPELGPRVVNLTSTYNGEGSVWDGEAFVAASRWSVHISDVPVDMSEAYPLDGPLRCYRMLEMGLDMPFGYLLASLSSKEAGLAAAEDDPSRALPELVYSMFVDMTHPIPDVYEASRVQMEVRVKGSKGPNDLVLPTGGFQKVVPVAGQAQRLHVTVDLQVPQMATEAERADKEYLAPSAMIDNSDEVIIELAHQIDRSLRAEGHRVPAKGSTAKMPPSSQLALAYALRDLVHGHISAKHLSTAYASASETARTGSGDCTEHAVLLAAVLKARNIPSRVCHGLVYVELGGSAISGEADGAGDSLDAPGAGEAGAPSPGGTRAPQTHGLTIDAAGSVTHPSGAIRAAEGQKVGQFGWHMWSQAMINGRWVDLDATLHVPYSVGHVLVGTSAMSDKDAHNNHMQMAALIGNLEIVLLEYSHKWEHAGKDEL